MIQIQNRQHVNEPTFKSFKHMCKTFSCWPKAQVRFALARRKEPTAWFEYGGSF